ncbi:UvrD-helicase domain-containing protein [Kineosporia sp. NBRC 101731]|uniref:HelD family protein n=1 Tax=Kineosporia sp. NBRC 101731 TaxID=3032199 RepID=UPI0024A1A4E0|nr:UvrD-helicase domain-containing protein [Kineosporia sp. NBRC 101731]GLY26657.1 DNA helicase [Kineosporia sp. NBRC 101731]
MGVDGVGDAAGGTQNATEREVSQEQAYVDVLYGRLDDIRSRAERTLDDLRRSSSSNTPAGRAEKDAFDALHTERLAQLGAVEDRLVFGRLDMTGGERRYVGRIGMSDEAQQQLLVDWRAPAAAAFYQATAASPSGVARRRHLATRGRTVTGIDDELLDAAGLNADDLTTVTGDGALMTALTEHRTGKMRDIVATLQSEQDEIVRAPLTGVLVVQGGPGTGKTAVALHRAAYLLYTHRERIAKSGVLVVGPSPVFLRYIERVLPSLGETGVVLSTPGQIFPGVEATVVDRPEVAVLKGDLRMARVIREAVRQRQLLLPKPIPMSLDGDQITLRPAAVAEARSRARQNGRPHNEARNTFVKHLLDDLAGQLARSRRLENDPETRQDLIPELRDSIDVRREINLRWMPLSAESFLDKLFSSPARLRAAAEGKLSKAESRLLLREAGSPWTQADMPLLDEVSELIGADVTVSATAARERARAAAERAEAVRYAQGVLQMSGEASAMMTADMLADRFEGPGGSLTVAERARDDRTWTYGHVVVDEAQEVSPMFWRTLARRVPTRSMTVVGDLAQTSSAAGATTWAGALDTIAKDRWRVAELTVNYRTPAKIMRPAAAMLTTEGISVRLPESAREGDWDPSLFPVARTTDEVVGAVLEALTADDKALGGGQFAVILSREAVTGEVSERVRKSLLAPEFAVSADRVSVLSVDDVKGLEYDAVTVVDPAGIIAASRRGASDLYVALTRPTQRLSIVHHGDLPKGLDDL